VVEVVRGRNLFCPFCHSPFLFHCLLPFTCLFPGKTAVWVHYHCYRITITVVITKVGHWQNIVWLLKIQWKMVLVIIFGKTNVQKFIILQKYVFSTFTQTSVYISHDCKVTQNKQPKLSIAWKRQLTIIVANLFLHHNNWIMICTKHSLLWQTSFVMLPLHFRSCGSIMRATTVTTLSVPIRLPMYGSLI